MVSRIQAWLAPPNFRFTDEYEHLIHLREPGTSAWIFDDQVYQYWYHHWTTSGAPKKPNDTLGANIVWVNG